MVDVTNFTVDVDCGEARTHDGFDHSGTHSGIVVADGPGPILSQRAGGPDPMEGIDWILSATADSLC